MADLAGSAGSGDAAGASGADGQSAPGAQSPKARSKARRAKRQATRAKGDQDAGKRAGGKSGATYAALDLGSNNCRLLVARKRSGGFEVVDSFSRIVRLAEGVSRTGELSPAAMERAIQALQACAAKLKREDLKQVRCVATHACRSAANGKAFVKRARAETGLDLQIISPREEAILAAYGCADLFDREADRALVVDIGGGSTEVSLVDLERWRARNFKGKPLVIGWTSMPYGVVSSSEAGAAAHGDSEVWRHELAGVVAKRTGEFAAGQPAFSSDSGGAWQLVGTSGALTSIAAVHLNLPRYNRAIVDGLWMDARGVDEAVARICAMSEAERAAHPCIGPDRGELLVAGCAILAGLRRTWPLERIRVADRGLREGLLVSMLHGGRRRGGRNRRRAGGSGPAPAEKPGEG